MPAPSFSVVCSEGFSADASSYTTGTGSAGSCGTAGSFTLAASKVALATWHGTDTAASASYPALTSTHGTWRQVATFNNASTSRAHAWCLETGAGASGTATIDFTGVGDTQNNGVFSVVEITDMETAGDCESNFLQKSEYQSTDTNTSTVTFAAFSDSNNRPVLSISKAVSGTATNDWTELWDTNVGGESRTATGCYNTSTADTNVVVTWSNVTSAAAHGILFEVVGAADASGDTQMGVGFDSGGFLD